MGREIKRVAANFDWPLGETWTGFINPHYKRCPENGKTCFNGQTAAAAWMDAIGRFLHTVATGCLEWKHQEEYRKRGMNAPHPYLTEWPQAPQLSVPAEVIDEIKTIKDDGLRRVAMNKAYREYPPRLTPMTPELFDVIAKFAASSGDIPTDWSIGGRGSWEIQKAFFKAAGIDRDNWGTCPVCDGECLDPAVKEVYDAWQQTPPPDGEWWQVWETVGEGSPVTPAFATMEGLVDYLVANGDAWDQKRGTGGWKRENAVAFCKQGWAPSMIVTRTADKNIIQNLGTRFRSPVMSATKELRTRLFIGIADERSDKVYRVIRLPADPGHLAWSLSYNDPVEGDVTYQVHQAPSGAIQCDCKGYRMHQQQCRHIRGMLAERLLRVVKGETE